jgi:hypothetical protein
MMRRGIRGRWGGRLASRDQWNCALSMWSDSTHPVVFSINNSPSHKLHARAQF